MWVRMWPWSSQGREKALPQMRQRQGRLWVRMCIFRAPRLPYARVQCRQLKLRRCGPCRGGRLRVWVSFRGVPRLRGPVGMGGALASGGSGWEKRERRQLWSCRWGGAGGAGGWWQTGTSSPPQSRELLSPAGTGRGG